MKIAIIAGAVMVCLVSTSSFAQIHSQELPNYDIAAICGSQIEAPRTAITNCYINQYNNRRGALAQWGVTGRETREHCAKNSLEDYAVLNACLYAH